MRERTRKISEKTTTHGDVGEGVAGDVGVLEQLEFGRFRGHGGAEPIEVVEGLEAVVLRRRKSARMQRHEAAVKAQQARQRPDLQSVRRPPGVLGA